MEVNYQLINDYKSLEKFGNENSYSVVDYGEFGWSLSNSNMGENLDIIIGFKDQEDCISICGKGILEVVNQYRLKDWDDITMDLSDNLRVKISDSKLFLARV